MSEPHFKVTIYVERNKVKSVFSTTLFQNYESAEMYGEDLCTNMNYFGSKADKYTYVVLPYKRVSASADSDYKKSLLALRDQLVKSLKTLDLLIDDA